MGNILYRRIAYGITVVVMLAGIVCYDIQLRAGTIDLSVLQLPKNLGDCFGPLLFIIFMFAAFVGTLWISSKISFCRLATIRFEGKNIGCIILAIPIGILFFAFYYLLYYFTVFLVSIPPWVILLIIVAVAVVAAWILWKRLKTMKAERFYNTIIALVLFYGIIAYGMERGFGRSHDSDESDVTTSFSVAVDSAEVQ